MSMTIDFSPQEEATLAAAAQQAGIAPPEFVRKVVQEHLPAPASVNGADPFLARLEARIAQAPTDPTIALIESWISQAPTDPEEIREAEEDLNEFKRNMNKPRKESGARLLYPEVE